MKTESSPKPFSYYMRYLHRDLGFFAIGLALIFSLSGIVLIYRDTDFLKQQKVVEKKLDPGMNVSDLARNLHMRDLKVLKTEADMIYFQSGSYNTQTGVAVYTSEELPTLLNRMIQMHSSSSEDPLHWFSLIFAVLLSFLTLSSLWMFKPKTRQFRRGICLAGAGIAISLVILLL